MRPRRSAIEHAIVERLWGQLPHWGITEFSIRTDITDRPDVVLDLPAGRLGIEICRLDYEAFCRWLASPPDAPYSRTAEVTVDLDKQLGAVMARKGPKYPAYVAEAGLGACWLLLYNNLYDFDDDVTPGVPNREWFERFARWTLQDLGCPFERVYFLLEYPERWFQLFDRHHPQPRRGTVHSWPRVIYREFDDQDGAAAARSGAAVPERFG